MGLKTRFKGKELLLEIYSRLLNPTFGGAWPTHIVDLEAGPYTGEYFAWNFNSGMAAIDAVLSHVLGRDDILITSRNIYGGAFQLIHDWSAKPAEPGDRASRVLTATGRADDFFWRRRAACETKYADRLATGRKGLSVSRIALQPARLCARRGWRDLPGRRTSWDIRVVLDATVAHAVSSAACWCATIQRSGRTS